MNTEELAGALYDAYSKAVGGKAWNNDPLPSWKEFRADQDKWKQSNAWAIVAQTAQNLLGKPCDPIKS